MIETLGDSIGYIIASFLSHCTEEKSGDPEGTSQTKDKSIEREGGRRNKHKDRLSK